MEFYKGTKTKCENYNTTVTTGEGYTGVTSKWGDPLEIDGNFYIPKHADYTHDTMEIVTELPAQSE